MKTPSGILTSAHRRLLGMTVIVAVIGAALFTAPGAAQATWSYKTDCSACHESQVQALSKNAHTTVTCASCHASDEKLADIHNNAKPNAKAPARLKNTKVQDGACLACHGDGAAAAPRTDGDASATTDKGDMAAKDSTPTSDKANIKQSTSEDAADADASSELQAKDDMVSDSADTLANAPAKTQLVAAAADCTLLTDDNGTLVNPHDLPINDDHAKVLCADCHKQHVEESDPTVEAPKKCASCHHKNVYECYTCHA